MSNYLRLRASVERSTQYPKKSSCICFTNLGAPLENRVLNIETDQRTDVLTVWHTSGPTPAARAIEQTTRLALPGEAAGTVAKEANEEASIQVPRSAESPRYSSAGDDTHLGIIYYLCIICISVLRFACSLSATTS